MRKLSDLDNISQLPDLVLCPLDNWDLISITGDDRISFLQGQLTCDLASLKPGQQTLAAQCNPQGKVFSIFRVIILEDRVLLTQPSSVTQRQLPELQKYAAFSKVEIKKETEYKALGLAGCQSAQYIAEKVDTAATHDQSRLLDSGTVIIKQPYPSLRYLAIMKNAIADELLEDLKNRAEIFDDSLWNAMNIASGIGFIEEQTSATFIPQMLNLQALDGISFAKGCYIGQETVARAKYRGANKRALFILTGRAAQAPKVGDNIQMLVSNNWKRIGTVISGCQYGDGHIEVLAVLPKDCSPEDVYQVKEIEGSTLYYAPLPYTLDED
ncbi:tRNA-modifying protein YgfZ [Psychromonas sp. Urea-02u-13]|uniref:tRNA-modifying protein YgfZ n=1 Tax=Psychromonas sp. Urea-02u-13 TaxID=2058326 RepID=UPI000C323973|nr:tRNA-modifying protein YgfZ [Psychromonas sp. Urea-02u-13]PKG38174.1 tRNA-modifying protein YgfZ [Psychromonas sp. Urea-02u-13]